MPAPHDEIVTVYGMTLSGNCHKVKLMLDLTGRRYEWIETDTRQKATRTEAFQALNPNGEVPLLKLPDGRLLPESNAILFYLADRTTYWPEDGFDRAQTLRWMFFEQYSHEPYIAVNRARLAIFKDAAPDDPAVQQRHTKGMRTLGVMNDHLSRHEFFVAGRVTIADVALFAYTHVAPEGGFDLDAFPELQAWLRRLFDHGFTAMPPASANGNFNASAGNLVE